MATIADELLNDFESDGEEQDEEQNDAFLADGEDTEMPATGVTMPTGSYQANGSMELEGDEEEPDDADMESNVPDHIKMEGQEDEEETKARVEKMQLQNVTDVRSVAGLMKLLQPVIERIEHYKNLPPDKQTKNIGSIEDNPEYKLLTLSNTLSTSIDGEIVLVHKFIRDHYSVRYPELETLIVNPLDYAKTVAIIGNGPMESLEQVVDSSDNVVGQTLRQVLDKPSLMVVTLEATTTRGVSLSEPELAAVRRACEMTLHLDKAKKTLTEYVQSRMSMFAPNLTTLIGSLTAAQLLNYAGGITGLAKTPSCNIPPLGSKKNTAATGLASNVGIRHQGFLYNNDIIRDVQTDLKVQAMRILSAKIVLAARVDQAHQAAAGEQGLEFYDQVQKRISKLSEAPPNKGVRALPAPDDKPARKRGGRRARKAKEATAVTDLRKAQNRMAFGKEEVEVGYGNSDGTKGMGMIGAQDDGRIRATQIDQRTRAKLSKKNPGWGGTTPAMGGTTTSLRGFGGTTSMLKGSAGLRTTGVGSGLRTQIGSATGGMTSTVAFTPVQGLELVDPKMRAERERKMKAEEDRWFKGGTFTQIGGGAANGGGAGESKVDSAGFKIPALPGVKKTKQEG
ncbi:U4/U6-U5 snRNP complex subunit prp31 [Friedmanniomyces endolithicus]|uniref:U4/U6-U5 snRNP complex subunit prp31 n=1 Tax=Friedmanniomyces endolithicus TaxID=329885 RepID=A0AAN6FT18_9PEZI|nr:U4/U6-U5 snRNP complex subunit prp31 [Friedmanniomyces endolithicus]KAK0288578.1 U4/U6-U5 snRNP complex subunit prp31 [Friedmanniomyces endolithicus]KAK0323605.1 U4/U6-U5 snRNP complex subunit prp31 [Friedmanniomyces endolithicus]KAK1006335.1 U4/U6-U5 snRNP complex subunit prp31 [Friedmanniomyces endolithicus]